jgi:hypothetical protein
MLVSRLAWPPAEERHQMLAILSRRSPFSGSVGIAPGLAMLGDGRSVDAFSTGTIAPASAAGPAF